MNKIFVVNPQNAHVGTEGVAYGTLAALPEKPNVAHVFDGNVAVWERGHHGDYWAMRPASAEQIAAFNSALRITPVAQLPTVPPAAVVPAAAAAVLSNFTPAASGNGWDAIIATAMRSGLVTPDLLQRSLHLIAPGGKPAAAGASHAKPRGEAIDAQAIYDARRGGREEAIWDAAIAQAEASRHLHGSTQQIDSRAIYAQRRIDSSNMSSAQPQQREAPQTNPLDPAAIYAARRQGETSAAAVWDKALAIAASPQRN
jgi:hypothetical protein